MKPEKKLDSGATFDPTGRYRYSLWREWDRESPRIAFVLLNPSTADATRNDPTIRRCIGFARSWGYGSVEVVNLFAYRSKDPAILRKVPDPIGPKNGFYIRKATRRARDTVVAWGNHGSLFNRDRGALDNLLERGDIVYCLGRTQAGHPRHPLYLKGDIMPSQF